ncbi:hypothetical protein WA1_08910 [Scytonema hofmannii PCC 7110]|uniref:SPOR domain-containing protein n=1 Tax=Scytonema hofmannii PCC 7110 TaxID=128403 RepID=A0A139WS65_9CYAN|nr:hypothetical protein [Scytonema hofmannii]KYC35263.1 hypothetical protein WA1_08910 [Scytonema hofmannii PCC 7110]
MYQAIARTLTKSLVSSLLLAFSSLIAGVDSAIAQGQNLPVCQPPGAGEYLLLVISPTSNSQNQLRRALPGELKTTTCRYLKDTVTRIGGFRSIDDANRWARYISHVVALSAIITTRPTDGAPSQNVTYKPERLGEGYAVLVDYYNRPEVANEVREVVGGDVGFATYGQRPYLLAVYTSNQKDAYTTLQKLSEQGFSAVLVDSRKVLLLRSAVRLQ